MSYLERRSNLGDNRCVHKNNLRGVSSSSVRYFFFVLHQNLCSESLQARLQNTLENTLIWR